MFIIDAHLDLSMNAMEWNRDLRSSLDQLRESEKAMSDKPDRGNGTVCLPALRKGNIGLVVATQIARFVPAGSERQGWHSSQQAWAQTQAQLAWYRAMEAEGEMIQIKDLDSLNRHIEYWNQPGQAEDRAIGYILSLEGADSMISIEQVEIAYQYGLRAIGPAHYGPGRYANGTDATGRMGEEGLALLKKMDELNIILDMTHLCDDAFWQSLDHFGGSLWASHNNCRALVNHNRQYSDDQIRALVQRNAVIGAAMDAWMIVPDWQRGVSTPQSTGCSLEKLIDHVDHICQLAGNALHVGIGSDLDGAFGKEQCPIEIDSISDLQIFPRLLKKRGYAQNDVDAIMHGNWLRFLRMAWNK
jgi:membrane dipeptidase